MHSVVMQDLRASLGPLVSQEPLERQVNKVMQAHQDQ